MFDERCSPRPRYRALGTYQRSVDGSLSAEFLLLDRLVPRSVYNARQTADEGLAELEARTGRLGVDEPARRMLGRARAALEFTSVDDKETTAEMSDDSPVAYR
jgi:uncharacterized alpha-E superfamily protein